MAECFLVQRGGAPLNFKVVGNPQPQNPKENTIWVDTDVDITAYHFSSEPISVNLDYSNLTNANDVISGRGDNGENFYGSLPIMWSKTYLLKTKLIAGVTYKLDSTGLGYGRIGAFRKLMGAEDYPIESYSIRIEGADPLSLLSKNRLYSIFTPIETTDAYFYYCTDADNTGSNPAFSVWFALYLVGNPIWISTDTSSAASFNALKKNGIEVCPISAKQYVSGAWVEVTAKIYQNRQWKPFWDGTLFYMGNRYEDRTGGWTGRRMSFGETTISATGSYRNDKGHGSIYNLKGVDVTKFNTLTVNITTAIISSNEAHFGLSASPGGDFAASAKITAAGTMDLDITNLKGEYYFLFKTDDNYTSATTTVAFDTIRLRNR